VPPGTLSSTGHRTGLTTQINIHPEHSHTRLQEGQYESSVPTTADRVVQASLKLVLEPIFEADFHPCSYGFRPGRRAHDAIAETRFLASRSYKWVVEGDITACLDAWSHCSFADCGG
jgi:retron-type reverse transcriptase